MNKPAKIIALICSGMILIISCTDKNNTSPYDDILKQPVFASLTDSIRKEPANDVLRFRRAVLLNKNNFPEPALADFQKAWSLKREEKYALGVGSLLLEKNPDSALVFLNKALKELPNSLLLKINLARAYDAKGETDAALLACDNILDEHPDQVDVLKMQAGLLDKTGNTDSTIQILEKAYQFAPYDIDLNYSLAYRYAEAKNAKILSLCDSLIRIDTLNHYAEPHYYKGLFYSNINTNDKALLMFEQAIQRNYQYLNAHIEKGRVLYEQKKFAAALKAFTLANTISPKFPDAWYWMGKSQEAMGQKDEAKLNYLKAYGLDQGFTEAKEAADNLK